MSDADEYDRAFETGLAETRAAVRAFCRRLKLSQEAAEDIAQGVLVRILEKSADPAKWKRLAIDEVREQLGRIPGSAKRRVLSALSLDDPAIAAEVAAVYRTDPHAASEFWEAMDAFSPYTRAVLSLSRVWGFTAEEVALVLGWDAKEVRRLLIKAAGFKVNPSVWKKLRGWDV